VARPAPKIPLYHTHHQKSIGKIDKNPQLFYPEIVRFQQLPIVKKITRFIKISSIFSKKNFLKRVDKIKKINYNKVTKEKGKGNKR
jgi:hypothetical protein